MKRRGRPVTPSLSRISEELSLRASCPEYRRRQRGFAYTYGRIAQRCGVSDSTVRLYAEAWAD